MVTKLKAIAFFSIKNNTLSTQSCAQQTQRQSRTLGAHPRRADPPSVRDRFAGRRPQHTLCTAKRNKDRGGLITPPFPQASHRCAIRGWRLHTQPVMVRPQPGQCAHNAQARRLTRLNSVFAKRTIRPAFAGGVEMQPAYFLPAL